MEPAARRRFLVEVPGRVAVAGSRGTLERQYERIRIALEEVEDEFEAPVLVVLTRIARGRLDEAQLAAALQTCRDAVVDALGIPFDDPGITWRRCQEERVGQAGLRIEICALEADGGG